MGLKVFRLFVKRDGLYLNFEFRIKTSNIYDL